MSLGDGEYVIISSCIRLPYSLKKIKDLLLHLKKYNCKFGETSLINIDPNTVTYHKIWNHIDDEIVINQFSYELLKVNVLSTIDIKLQDNISARLQLQFLDEVSYEVSLLLNYTQLIDEELSNKQRLNHASMIEKLGLLLFERLDPLYGHIGVERSVPGLTYLLRNEERLPSDRVYLTNQLIEDVVTMTTLDDHEDQFVFKIPNQGIYFRNISVDDFVSSHRGLDHLSLTKGLTAIKKSLLHSNCTIGDKP